MLRLSQAASDLVIGLSKRWLWIELAKQDIRLRYRGSLLGPLWLTFSTLIMTGSMGFIYAKLFHADPASYLPFLTLGLIVWQFVATLVTEGCFTFISVAGIIQQVSFPHSIHAYRLVFRNLIVLAHNLLVVPIVLLIFHIVPSWEVVWIVPAVALLCVNGVWISILCGMLSARFRDVPPIVANFVQVMFFVTPVFWGPEALGEWRSLGEFNPLFAAIDVIRAPLMGSSASLQSWLLLVTMTVVGSGFSFIVFARLRHRIPFWA